MKRILLLLLVVWTTAATAANIAAPRTILFDGRFTKEKLAKAIMDGTPIGNVPEQLEPVWAEYESLPLSSRGAHEPAVEWLVCVIEGEEFHAFVQYKKTWWGKLKLYRLVIKKAGIWQEADKETIQYMEKHKLLLAIDYEGSSVSEKPHQMLIGNDVGFF